MALTGAQRQQVVAALLDAFPTEADLTAMVSFWLDTSLPQITQPGTLKAVVFQLVNWAEGHGKLRELITGAHAEAPDNPAVQAIWAQIDQLVLHAQMGGTFQQRKWVIGGLLIFAVAVVATIVLITPGVFRPACQREDVIVPDTGAILALAAESENGITRWWMGKAGQGLSTLTSTTEFALAHPTPVAQAELGNRTVLAMAVDESKQQVWVGTSGSGLMLVTSSGQTIARYTTADGLAGCDIGAVDVQPTPGEVYVGFQSSASKLIGVRDQNGAWRSYDPPSREISTWTVYTMMHDAAGNAWIGTTDNLLLFASHSWSPQHYLINNESRSTVRAAVIDTLGLKWIGYNGGLALLDDRTGPPKWITPTSSDIAGKEVQAIDLIPATSSELKNNTNALVGTQNGLFICSHPNKDGNITLICKRIQTPGLDKLGQQDVYSIAVGPDGQEALIGTNDPTPIHLLRGDWQAMISSTP